MRLNALATINRHNVNPWRKTNGYGMTAGVSRKGNCRDIALTERFFRSLKSERLAACRFVTRNKAKNEILDFIIFDNIKPAIKYNNHILVGPLIECPLEVCNVFLNNCRVNSIRLHSDLGHVSSIK